MQGKLYFLGASTIMWMSAPEGREARFHLNALKFLESYCSDCLKITQIKNNGDGTIDLTVQITHPFKGFPQFTGFDVKGILMFDGSYQVYNDNPWHNMQLPEPFYLVSWRQMGDPEVLNADGYTPRWSPVWDQGSDQPMFNDWPGKYVSGLPCRYRTRISTFIPMSKGIYSKRIAP